MREEDTWGLGGYREEGGMFERVRRWIQGGREGTAESEIHCFLLGV